MTDRNAITIIPPHDPELAAYERLAARYPGESVYTKWLGVQERAVERDARIKLRNLYASRGNCVAAYGVYIDSLPAVIKP